MNKVRLLLLSITLLPLTAAAAEEFNGTSPMLCEPLRGHDCLPTETACKPLKPEPGKDLNMRFDVQKMIVRAPYRNDTLPIQSFGYNSKSLVMQGTSLDLVWSAAINRTTGQLTIAIADREGAYVVFGQCRLERTDTPAAKQQSR
ncbi:MAG TPA: hypothetical protein VHK24_07040 [Steroidobacter sp.]|jgi:hypothetical protein|nr:hypothetical protein [Steroidobacter sp.]